METIQIMVAACASGEEPYSIAIMLAEIFKQKSLRRPVMIAGVDLNPVSIMKAQEGFYAPTALKEMNARLIDQYFIREDAGYRILNEIKDMCSFAQNDIVEVNVSAKYDLISCRNLLIYLKAELQQQLIEKFYHDLKPGGLLFLGQAENLGLYGGQYFIPVDYSHRLYRRRPS